MRAPKWLSRIYQTNSRVHLALAPIRHGLVALRNLARPGDLHQAWGTTRLNRRPKLMKALSEIVRDEAGVKVLSFGCSSGEEVLDIRQYYRQATVFGTDLNRKSLKKAQRLLRGTGVQLFVSTDENIQEHGPYTLIMACSVFIRHPEDTHTDDLSTLYPFEVFERGICRLFENTIVGGYLLIHNADYRVTDTRVGPRLRPVRHSELMQNPHVPLFDRTGRKLGVTGYDEQLFRRES